VAIVFPALYQKWGKEFKYLNFNMTRETSWHEWVFVKSMVLYFLSDNSFSIYQRLATYLIPKTLILFPRNLLYIHPYKVLNKYTAATRGVSSSSKMGHPMFHSWKEDSVLLHFCFSRLYSREVSWQVFISVFGIFENLRFWKYYILNCSKFKAFEFEKKITFKKRANLKIFKSESIQT
jgi:hypothetical protein